MLCSLLGIKMAKQRINLLLGDETIDVLSAIAHSQNKQVGTIARKVLEDAVEELENKMWLELALNRKKETELSGEECLTWEEVKNKFKDKN